MIEPIRRHRAAQWGALPVLLLILGLVLAGQASAGAPGVAASPAAADPASRIDAWSAEERAAAEAGDGPRRIDALLHRAEAYQALGMLGQAAADLQAALGLARAARDAPRTAVAEGMLGAVYLSNGNLDSVEGMLRGSIAAAEPLRLHDVLAASLMNRGLLEIARGRPEGALPWLERGLEQARLGGDPLLVTAVDINLARALLNAGRAAAAQAPLAEAGAILEGAAGSPRTAYLLVALAVSMERVMAGEQRSIPGYAGRIERALRTAADLAERAGDQRTQSFALGHLGHRYEIDQRRADALGQTRQAAFLAQRLGEPAILYQWEWQSARLLADAGDRKAAIAANDRAIGELQRFRYDLVVAPDAFGGGFREVVGPIYAGLADLLLQQAKAETGSDRSADLRKARDTMERFKSAELEDYFRDDCVASLKSKTKGIDALAEDTAALYPILLPDRIELILTLGGNLDLVTVPVPAATVTAEVHEYRRQLERVATRQFLRPSQQLYDWLIRPVEAKLAAHGVKTLIFVPDGALRTVPIGALHDGRRFLIESYATVVEPGLTLLDPRPIPRQAVRALLSALTEARQGYPSLPSAGVEVDEIAKLYDSRVLRNQTYRLATLQQALAETPYTVVHFASHGEFAERADRSFILTYDDKLTLDKLEQFIKLSRFRATPVELLVLSACRTAAGNDRAALGLAGIAIKAGARSAVASLWSINDEVSERLIAAFYGHLRDPKLSKAEALRRAQVALLDDRRFRHPGYWSAFLLIGNWL